MARKIYRVVPDGSMWELRGPSGSTLSRHQLKSAAVTAGQSAAKANQPSQLVVSKQDGTFDYESTYGDDPYPPKG